MMHARKLVLAATLALSACAIARDQGAGGAPPPASPILSAQELDAYLRTTPSSPLDRLPAAARQRFLASLVFTEAGLASYQYSDLQTLSPTEVYRILSLFGAERSTSIATQGDASGQPIEPAPQQNDPGSYIDCMCLDNTCVPRLGSICMDAC